MRKRSISLKEKVGCLLLDIPRLIPALIFKNQWIRVWNRKDSLKIKNGGVDTSSTGPWSSDIQACYVYPWIGKRLLKLALQQWPIDFETKAIKFERPDISFIIPHRGMERLPLLVITIKTILAQKDISVECIVVEQNTKQEVSNLPPGVKYIHLPHPNDPIGWRKSWAYNVGVSKSSADIVVCHDGDILVPCDYGKEIIKHIKENNCEVVHLQRLLFCMGRFDTSRILFSDSPELNFTPDRVRQNWKGGTLAITKDAYFKIGGFDETFEGWSGEDREFYDRCLTLRGSRQGYLPFVHLWHPSQPSKVSRQRAEHISYTEEIMSISREQRILKLAQKQNVQNPSPLNIY